jgi:NAD-dependent DNA ligase
MAKCKNGCIAITGELKLFTRDQAMRAIHLTGCNYAFDITKDTTHLVVGSSPDPGKVIRASRNRLTLISEEDFIKRIANKV